MAKKGGQKKLKRLAAPRAFKIPRKQYKWVVNPMPGPHPKERCIPVALLLRDYLGIAKNLREVKYILRKGYLKVDGEEVKEYRYPLGLMDVIELVPTKQYYRLLPSGNYILKPIPIEDVNEANIKPLRIKNKTMVKGAKIQLTTHDGRNFLLDSSSEYYYLKPGDTLIYSISDKKLTGYIKMEPGVYALVIGGSRMGSIGRIEEIKKVHPLKPKVVRLKLDEETIETIFDYVFPIGVDKPIINVGG